MLFANPNKQKLINHSYAVGRMAVELISKMIPSVDNNLLVASFISGCLHDLGKNDPLFQKWCNDKKAPSHQDDGHHITKKSFTFKDYPRHNELSIALYVLLKDGYNGLPNQMIGEMIEHVIYWHHAKPKRDSDLESVNDILNLLSNKNVDINDFSQPANDFISGINQLVTLHNFSISIPSLKPNIDPHDFNFVHKMMLPEYKSYAKQSSFSGYERLITLNAKTAVVRSAVITADRIISAVDSITLDHIVKNQLFGNIADQHLQQNTDLSTDINAMLLEYGIKGDASRNTIQSNIANDLANISDVSVLQGPAGVGKTKTALEWAMKTNTKRIIWVCPRVQVCQSIYHELTTDYLPYTAVEICTGELKYVHQNGKTHESHSIFTGDVIITTIDQIVNAIITHKNVTTLVDFMNSHVIFDEFHEYIHMPCFNILFYELLKCKSLKQQPTVLLASATPNYVFINDFLGIDKNHIVKMQSFNNSSYELTFNEYDEDCVQSPIFNSYPPDTIVISNLASVAQLSFITNSSNENALLMHSKFTRNDKQVMFDNVIASFGKNGTKQYDILRASPVVQASLNITSSNMVTDITCAENWMQRMGRLDRFGEHSYNNIYTTVYPSRLSGKKNTGRFLSRMYILDSSRAWLDFLKNNVKSTTYTIKDIYDLYEKFYQDSINKDAVITDINEVIDYSITLLKDRVLDPVQHNRYNTDDKPRIKAKSLRGDNVFVQMSVIEVDDQSVLKDSLEYIYEEDCDLIDDNRGSLTLEVAAVKGYDETEESPLSFMIKKHHNIKANMKKPYKQWTYIKLARDSDTPIYTSYTAVDLQKVSASNIDSAYHYVKTEKQPVGILMRKKLLTVVK